MTKTKTTTKNKSKNKKVKTENDSYVLVKAFCQENNVTRRIFENEAKRQGFKILLVKGESTNNQVTAAMAIIEAEHVLEKVQNSLVINEDDILVQDLAKKFRITVEALKQRMKNKNITGHKVRYPATVRNPKLRNQWTVAVSPEDAEKLKIKKKSIIQVN
jgi:hypothetical protein